MPDALPLPPARQLPAPLRGGYLPPSPLPPEVESSAPPLELREILRLLRRRAWLVVASTLLCTGAAAYLTLTAEPSYRAGAVIRLADGKRELTGGLITVRDENRGRSSIDPVLSQLQLLATRAVAGQVVDSEPLGLRVRPEGMPASLLDSVHVATTAAAETLFFEFGERDVVVRGMEGSTRLAYGEPGSVDGVRFTVAAAPPAPRAELIVRSRESAIGLLLRNLSAKPREQTDVVDVQFIANDPRVAQRVVNRVVAVFEGMSVQTAQQQSRRRRLFIEEQLRQNDAQLVAAERELSDFRRREQAYSSKEKVSAEQTGLMGLEVRREELDADRRMYLALLGRLEGPPGSATSERLRTLVSSPEMAANPLVVQLYEQLGRYETTRDSLTTGPWALAQAHPEVQRLDTLVAMTQGRLVGALRSHIASLAARIDALDGLKARASGTLQNLSTSEAEEVRLLQQVAILRTLTDNLRQEHQQTRIAEAAVAGQVEVVDQAVLPSRPMGAGPVPKLVFGLLLGLLLGGVAAAVTEHLNTSIRRREDLERVLHLPGLATIPRITGAPRGGLRGLLGRGNGAGRVPARRHLNGRNGANGAQEVAPPPAARGLVTLTDLHSPAAEAYRSLRTSLLFSQAVRQLRTVLVTSASPEEGKTTTAANLAVTFAQQGRRVLLIDCDLRHPRVDRVFALARSPGLTELVLGRAEPAEVLRPAGVDGLYVLPSGTPPPNPSELLGSPRMLERIAEMLAEFEVLLIDSPPVLVAGDAAILASTADAVLLVTRAGHTERGAAQEALRQLSAVGARVVGAVLNDPDEKTAAHGEYFRYGYAPQSGARV